MQDLFKYTKYISEKKKSMNNLMAAIALIRLFSAVHPLVPVQVVTLNEPHITSITRKWLFPWKTKQNPHTGKMNLIIADFTKDIYI